MKSLLLYLLALACGLHPASCEAQTKGNVRLKLMSSWGDDLTSSEHLAYLTRSGSSQILAHFVNDQILNLPFGRYILNVHVADHASKTMEFELRSSTLYLYVGTEPEGRIDPMPPTPALDGQVKGIREVTDVWVRITGIYLNLIRTVPLRNNEYFTIESVPNGVYDLLVLTHGRVIAQRRIEVRSGNPKLLVVEVGRE